MKVLTTVMEGLITVLQEVKTACYTGFIWVYIAFQCIRLGYEGAFLRGVKFIISFYAACEKLQ